MKIKGLWGGGPYDPKEVAARLVVEDEANGYRYTIPLTVTELANLAQSATTRLAEQARR